VTWVLAVLVVAVLGGVALVAAGRLDASLPPVEDDSGAGVAGRLPDGPLTAPELRRVRLPLAVRGYRMAEVDALLARLADQLEDRLEDDDPDARGGREPG